MAPLLDRSAPCGWTAGWFRGVSPPLKCCLDPQQPQPAPSRALPHARHAQMWGLGRQDGAEPARRSSIPTKKHPWILGHPCVLTIPENGSSGNPSRGSAPWCPFARCAGPSMAIGIGAHRARSTQTGDRVHVAIGGVLGAECTGGVCMGARRVFCGDNTHDGPLLRYGCALVTAGQGEPRWFGMELRRRRCRCSVRRARAGGETFLCGEPIGSVGPCS